jgi:hypothetical protein
VWIDIVSLVAEPRVRENAMRDDYGYAAVADELMIRSWGQRSMRISEYINATQL